MKWKEQSQFENPPVGSFVGRCYGICDMGSQVHSWAGEQWTSRDVKLSFELPTELMEGKYNSSVRGLPFSVHITTKQSLHASSKLRQLLEGWRGKKFTKEEAATFDPKKLLGLPCRLALIESGEYINIASISPLGKNEKCPPQLNPSVFFSLEPSEFSQAVFDKLHEKTKEKISKTAEFLALNSAPAQAGPDDGMPPDDGEPQDPF